MQTIPAGHPKLWLSPHVCACHSDGQVIMLDLRSSRYLGVSQCVALTEIIGGWPASPFAPRLNDFPRGNEASVVERLLAQGLLTDQPVKAMPPRQLDDAVHSLNAEDALSTASPGPRRLSRFLVGAITTAMALRYRSLMCITEAVIARRATLVGARKAVRLDDLREPVATYEKLRPLVFTARDRCLFDSLALLRFLAGEGLCPQWVIGVRTRPFAAHSWLQWGTTVLNDQHDHVRRFRPILVV